MTRKKTSLFTSPLHAWVAEEDVLGVEPRHRVAHKLRTQADENIQWQDENNDNDLHMTRELQAANY
jgi:hypothetical protein